MESEARTSSPGSCGHVRLAAVAKERESRSREGDMQSGIPHAVKSFVVRPSASPRAPIGRDARGRSGPERDELGRRRWVAMAGVSAEREQTVGSHHERKHDTPMKFCYFWDRRSSECGSAYCLNLYLLSQGRFDAQGQSM